MTLRQAVEDDVLCGYDIPKDTILLLAQGPMMRWAQMLLLAHRASGSPPSVPPAWSQNRMRSTTMSDFGLERCPLVGDQASPVLPLLSVQLCCIFKTTLLSSATLHSNRGLVLMASDSRCVAFFG